MGGWVLTGTTSKIFPENGATEEMLKLFDEKNVEMLKGKYSGSTVSDELVLNLTNKIGR